MDARCLQFLAIVDKAAMHFCVWEYMGHMSSFLLGKCPWVELLGHDGSMLFPTNVPFIPFHPKKGSFFALCPLPSAKLDPKAFIAQGKNKRVEKHKKGCSVSEVKALESQEPGLLSCKARAMKSSR